jgi:hypothetical protein
VHDLSSLWDTSIDQQYKKNGCSGNNHFRAAVFNGRTVKKQNEHGERIDESFRGESQSRNCNHLFSLRLETLIHKKERVFFLDMDSDSLTIAGTVYQGRMVQNEHRERALVNPGCGQSEVVTSKEVIQ